MSELRVVPGLDGGTVPRMRLALPRPGLLDLLDPLFGPFRRMVAWAEPWDIEDDEEDAA